MKNMKIDAVDRKIMTILEKNSRTANTEIAKSLKISEATVRNRIKKLEETGIMRNISVFNPEALGYQIHVIVGVEVEYKKIKQVTKKLNESEALFFVGNSTGRYDIMFVAFFRSLEDQYRFMVDEISKIDGILKTETSTILKMTKATYVWGISPSQTRG